MSGLKKFLLWFLLALLGLLAGIYLFLSANGRRIFNEQASSLTKRKVTVQQIAPRLPVGVELKGLTVEGLLSVRRVQVLLDPLALLRGRIRIASAELQAPVVLLERGADAKLALPSYAASAGPASAPGAAAVVKPSSMPVVVVHALSVSGGEVHLKDLASGKEWVLGNIRGTVRDIPLANYPVRTVFQVTASLEKLNVPFVGRALKTSGWVNWAAKDMDAVVQVADDQGRVGLDAKLLSRADDLRVAGQLRLSAGQSRSASSRRSSMVEDAVLGVLGALETGLEASFSFRTAMDRFEMGEVAFSGKISSGLNSGKTLGTIVDEIRTVGEELVKKDKAGKQP